MILLCVIAISIILLLSLMLMAAGFYYGTQKTNKKCNEYILENYEPINLSDNDPFLWTLPASDLPVP